MCCATTLDLLGKCCLSPSRRGKAQRSACLLRFCKIPKYACDLPLSVCPSGQRGPPACLPPGGDVLYGPAGPCSGCLWEQGAHGDPCVSMPAKGSAADRAPAPVGREETPLLECLGKPVSAGWCAGTLRTSAPLAPQLKARRVPHALRCW